MKQDEWCDEEGAKKLAQRIREYWARKGHTVDVTLQPEAFVPQMRSAYWSIRSDMVDARPRYKKRVLDIDRAKAPDITSKINVIRKRNEPS